MSKKNISMPNELEQISTLLEEALDIYRQDRALAEDILKDFRKQLFDIITNQDMEMSEEGKIEKAVNDAFANVVKAGQRLDNVIMTISKIITTQLVNESRESVAAKIFGLNNRESEKIIEGPVDITKMLEEKKVKNDYDKMNTMNKISDSFKL